MGFVYTVSQSNNNPRVIAMYYLEAIRRLGVAPRLLRCDTGTENSFLHMGQGFPHQLPVLENVILHPPCKTSRVR